MIITIMITIIIIIIIIITMTVDPIEQLLTGNRSFSGG